jgi:hypothetical protein
VRLDSVIDASAGCPEANRRGAGLHRSLAVLPYLSSDVAKRFQPSATRAWSPRHVPCELHGGTADKLGIGVVLDFVQVYALAEAAGSIA